MNREHIPMGAEEITRAKIVQRAEAVDRSVKLAKTKKAMDDAAREGTKLMIDNALTQDAERLTQEKILKDKGDGSI